MSLGCRVLLLWIMINLQTDHFAFSDGCLQDERSYLLDFRAGLNLSSGQLSSWRGLNCCQWEGVACDYHTSHVITLDLTNDYDDWESHRLSGELRPSLFNLRHLQHLDLTLNNFQGISIPPQLSNFQRLTFLSLSRAGFGGEVPLELGNMSSLLHLDLGNDYRLLLKSSKFDVWVSKLRSLEFLDMSYVNLSKSSDKWGEALNSLPNLTQIDLRGCELSGKIPNLSNLIHLSFLDLDENLFPFELPTWFQNVTSLDLLSLSFCSLKGSIPCSFMPLSKLSVIAFRGNPDLKVEIPFLLNHSSSLLQLDLGYSNSGGMISPVIGNFSKLEVLDLRYNQQIGQIPASLYQLSALVELHLDGNQLSGKIPDSISNLSSLQRLSLSSNRLEGNVSLQLFDNLTRLQVLCISENQLFINISPNWVPQFVYLNFLGLGSCKIEGTLPAFLSQQFLLVELDLSNNNIVGNIPSWLWDLPNLDRLNLSYNQLEGSLPRQLPHRFVIVDLHENRFHGSLPAPNFVSDILDLSDNEFNGSIPAKMGEPFYLSLSGNNLIGEIPSSACTDSNNNMVLLDLSNNKLTGAIPANIGMCSRLEVLKLAQNVLQGEIPKELSNLQSLRTLNLNGNMLQGTIPSSILSCRALQVFDLGNNKFEGTIPVWIEKLTDLRILSFTFNKFRDRIPDQLMRLPNLQILDLSSNHLSGNIPDSLSMLYAMVNQSQSADVQSISEFLGYAFYELPHFLSFDDEVTVWIKGKVTPYKKIISADKFMDLSGNDLSGNVPRELGLLKGLISLNISNNNINGSIPEALGAMAQLESLDLSKNKLSGKIPSQLLNLTFLEVLNLSDNMLSGLIPQGKQFSTFEASSFLGNPNLHGPQLENKTLKYFPDSNNKGVENGDANVEDPWWAVGLGLSYGVGFATVIAILCFHIEWRYIYFSAMDNLIYYLFER